MRFIFSNSTRVLAIAACSAVVSPVLADTPSSLWFFGDSLTDEGRNGRTASTMWPEIVRADLGVNAGYNFAIGGAITSNQPSTTFGDSSFLGQVGSFVTSTPALGANPVADVWIGTNNIWIGSAHGLAPMSIISTATTDVKTGLTQLAGAGVHSYNLLGVYDLSLTNAFELAGANTLNVRASAGVASQQYNASLASLQIPGATTTFYNMASFINYLQHNPQQYGFLQILPLAPGATCDVQCQQTSIFADTIHLTSKMQTLIGNYVAGGNPTYNTYPITYGALASDVWSASGAFAADLQTVQGASSAFSQGLLDQLDAARGTGATDPRRPFEAFAYGQIAGARVGDTASFDSGRFDWFTPGFTGGVSYLLRPDLRLGATFGLSESFGSLGGLLTSRNIEGALFASFSRPNVYVDAVAAVGAASLAQTRTGSFGSLTSHPDASSVGATVRAAYLFDVGMFKIGPILQAALSRTALSGFAESGDPFYAIALGRQSAVDLTGDIGVEARIGKPSDLPLEPFLDIMVERHFLAAPTVTPYFASLPTQLLPGATVAYPRLAVRGDAGVDFPLGGAWSGRITASAAGGPGSFATYGVNLGVAHAY